MQKKLNKKVLINVEDKDIRVAILEDGELAQLFVESIENKSIVGNIYKGRVDSIVPGLQAVFVDIGLERNAFLHFADVNDNYSVPMKGAPQRSNSNKGNKSNNRNESNDKGKSKKKSHELKTGDEILVQAVKEPMGTKGARLTSYISLPGRYLVMLPFSDDNSGGVSRRIEDGSERRRLRSILKSLESGEGSFIIRTAGLQQEEDEIAADVNKLRKLWTRIKRSAAQKSLASLVHDDHDILGRIVRDELTGNIQELLIDSKTHARQLRQILASMMPEMKNKVKVHDSMQENLFDAYGVEKAYEKALRRKVWSKSGGYIVVDETEALIAIDVNSGKFTGKGDQEETILQVNLEAADTIAQQLRLRDIGGIIVIDFIDMRSRENQRKLVNHFKDLLKNDRAKTTVSPLSDYGLLQMTRKRVRQSLSKTVFRKCPYCVGSGYVLSEQHIWKKIKYDILDMIQENQDIRSLRITVHPSIREYLEAEMLEAAQSLANYGNVRLNIADDKSYHLEQVSIVKD
ncbi:MAG: ribonuclease E/G [Candidatus Sumerlaeia bacterium]